jgi:hypothetical protein
MQQEARRILGAELIREAHNAAQFQEAVDVLKRAVDADPHDEQAKQMYDYAKHSLDADDKAEFDAWWKTQDHGNSFAKLGSALLGVAEGISAGADGGGGGDSQAGTGSEETKKYNESRTQMLQQQWANTRKCGFAMGCEGR